MFSSAEDVLAKLFRTGYITEQVTATVVYLAARLLFPINETILELAKVLIAPGAIPAKAGPDAVHIAAAAVEECEFLLTWNFRHIANVHIRRRVETILRNHGYTKTTICTPEELF